MSTEYKVTTEGGHKVFERLVYPRFKAVVGTDHHLPYLKDIEILDKISKAEDIVLLTKALEENNYFKLVSILHVKTPHYIKKHLEE